MKRTKPTKTGPDIGPVRKILQEEGQARGVAECEQTCERTKEQQKQFPSFMFLLLTHGTVL